MTSLPTYDLTYALGVFGLGLVIVLGLGWALYRLAEWLS